MLEFDTLTDRQVLAFLATAAAPVPELVRFSRVAERDPVLGLDLYTIPDLREWMVTFGGSRDAVAPWQDPGDERVSAHEELRWRGWRVVLYASSPLGQLDAATVAALRDVAAGGMPVVSATQPSPSQGG